MKVEQFKIKEENYKGNTFYTLYIVIDKEDYKIGTIKKGKNCNFINCVHKEYKENK